MVYKCRSVCLFRNGDVCYVFEENIVNGDKDEMVVVGDGCIWV